MLNDLSYDNDETLTGAATVPAAATLRAGKVTLPDGRALGYAEYGDPDGRPVFYCHGFPGSRHEAGLAHRAALAVRARLLSFDRPGYGLSDHRAGRTMLDWPRDLAHAANQLGIERFALLGVSGGAPYALACAHAIPRRLTRVGIVCGMGPAHEAALRRTMMWTLRTGLTLAQRRPALFRPLYALLMSPLPRWLPRALVWLLSQSSCVADRASLRRADVKQTLAASVHEAFRQGARAAARDVELYAAPWGFDICEIQHTVLLWHGETDPTVPVSMGRYLAAHLPHCRARFVTNEGHFSLPVNHAEEILATLLDSTA